MEEDAAGANAVSPADATPKPAVRRPSGLYVLLGLLMAAATVQAAFIAFLHFSVDRGVNRVLDGLAASPLLQEVERLQQRKSGGPPPPDPNRFYVPPAWDDAFSPGSERPAAQSPRPLSADENVAFTGFPRWDDSFERALDFTPLRAPESSTPARGTRAGPAHSPERRDMRAAGDTP